MKIEQIKKWKRLQATLKTIKAQEMELRKELCKDILQGKLGTVNTVVDKFKLKAAQQTRLKVDSEALQAIWSDLTPEEQNSVKWSPEVIKSKYNALSDKDMINSVITTVPNAPTLKIETIK